MADRLTHQRTLRSSISTVVDSRTPASTTKLSCLVETTGGASQERQATTFAGIADGAEDSGTRKIKVQAGKTVTHAGWWEVKKP